VKGKKTGGRKPGSLNRVRGLTRRREKVRRQAVITIEKAMPRLQEWLVSSSTWRDDGALAARTLNGLMQWVLPRYGQLDPHAEQQAEQQAVAERVEPVSAETVLEMLRSMPPTASVLEAPALEPSLEPLPGALERLGESESARLRGDGIPLEDGARFLPASAPQPAVRPDPAALAAMDRPTLDARPVRETRRPEEFTNGLIQNPPPLDPSLRPMGWR
jgi:hypothetical protein